MAVNYDAYFTRPPWDLDDSRFHLFTGKPRKNEPPRPRSRTRPGWPAPPQRKDYAILRRPRPPEEPDEPKVPWWLLTSLVYAVPIVVVVALVLLVAR